MREVLPPGQEVFFIVIFLACSTLRKEQRRTRWIILHRAGVRLRTRLHAARVTCQTYGRGRHSRSQVRRPRPPPSSPAPLSATRQACRAGRVAGVEACRPRPPSSAQGPALGRSDFEKLETSRTGSLPSNSRVAEASSAFSRRGKREINSHSVLCFFCLLSYKQIANSK